MGTQGSAQLRRGGWGAPADGYTVASKIVSSSGEATGAEDTYAFGGVQAELLEFYDAILGARAGSAGSAQALGSPAEAFTDLAMVWALLEAAESGGAAAPVEALAE